MKMTRPARAVPVAVLMACAVMACALVTPPGVAAAQRYPDRPVRIIVPIGAGGPYDFVGRLLANRLSDLLGQTFFVENRSGAGTLVGTQSAAAAPPHGYTLLVGGLSNLVFNFALYQKIGYEPAHFVPIALVYSFPYVMVARRDLPQKSLCAAEPGQAHHRPCRLRKRPAGRRRCLHEAHRRHHGRGALPQDQRRLSRHAGGPRRPPVRFGGGRAALHRRQQGPRGRAAGAAAVSDDAGPADHRRGGAAAAGHRILDRLFAPAGTPPDVLDRLRSATRIAADELKPQFEKSGGRLMQVTAAGADKFIKSEFDLWTRVIRDAGIRLD
jgi:hypothetical protein